MGRDKINMNNTYGDESKCLICKGCGMCINCGDCYSFGCGKAIHKPLVNIECWKRQKINDMCKYYELGNCTVNVCLYDE